MAFGSGTHRCIAEHLSFVELEVGLRGWAGPKPWQPAHAGARWRLVAQYPLLFPTAAARCPACPAPQEAFKGLFSRLPGLKPAVPPEALEWSDPRADVGLAALPVTW